jgi:hypothetical protein
MALGMEVSMVVGHCGVPVVALLCVKIVVGNNVGRSEIDRLSRERRAMRKADKNKLQPLTK